MKRGIVLLSFLILSMIAFSISVNAADYETNIEKGDEFVSEVKVLDEDAMEEVFGKDWDDTFDGKIGDKMKYEVTKVDNDEFGGIDFIILTVKMWDWTDDESDFEDDEDLKYDINIPEDPDDCQTQGLPIALLSPVEEYLEAALEAVDDDDITSEGTTKTEEKEEEEKYEEVTTYDSNNGFPSKQQIIYDDVVIYEAGIAGIPGYDLPMFFGVTSITVLGLVYIIMRKR